jgi:hypothetical protein
VPEALLDLLRGLLNGGLVGDVQCDREHISAGGAHLRRGLLAVPRVSGADQDRHAQADELLGSLSTDPLVRPGDQRDLLVCRRLAHDLLLRVEAVLLRTPFHGRAGRARSGPA